MKTGVTVLVSKTNSPSSHCIQLLAAASESFASFDTGILAVLSTTVSECFTDIEGIVKNASTQTLPSVLQILQPVFLYCGRTRRNFLSYFRLESG